MFSLGKIIVSARLLVLMVAVQLLAACASTPTDVAATVASAAILNETSSRIISEAERAANAAIGNAGNVGDALVTRAGDQVNALADNARRILGDEINLTIGKLSKEKRDLLIALSEMTTKLQAGTLTVQNVADTVVLDLRAIIGETIFAKNTFVIQRITGLTQLQGRPAALRVVGSYVGLPGSDHKAEVKVFLDGVEVAVRQAPTALHERTLEFTDQALERHMLEDKVAIVPLTLRINQQFKKCTLFVFCGWRDEVYDVPVHMALFPGFAGNVKAEISTERFDWGPARFVDASRTGGDNHCERSCGGHRGSSYSVSITVSGGIRGGEQVLGDQKILTISQCKCVSGECGYDENNGTSINANRTTATCSWQGRSHPSTWYIGAEVSTWMKLDAPIQQNTYALHFGEITKIQIPRYATSIRLTGDLLTGGKIDMLVSQNTPNPYLEIVDHIQTADGAELYIKARPPAGL